MACTASGFSVLKAPAAGGVGQLVSAARHDGVVLHAVDLCNSGSANAGGVRQGSQHDTLALCCIYIYIVTLCNSRVVSVLLLRPWHLLGWRGCMVSAPGPARVPRENGPSAVSHLRCARLPAVQGRTKPHPPTAGGTCKQPTLRHVPALPTYSSGVVGTRTHGGRDDRDL